MDFMKTLWKKYKRKSLWSKLSDAVFVALIVLMLLPDGRVLLQRGMLQTGILGSISINEDRLLSPASKQWALTDLEGNTINLHDLQGQVIFLNLWGTWCPPCNAEMPGILTLMERTDPKVKFIFATNEPANRVQQHLTRKGWALPAYTYRAGPGLELTSESLPSTFIIDRYGKVVHSSSGMKKWNTQEAENLLNRLAQ